MTSTVALPAHHARRRPSRLATLPPELYFVVSAIFHYLGPAFAVLLFARVDVLGVAWLRIASAALVFVVWRQPWRALVRMDSASRRLVVAWGTVLAVMNCCFYLAIDRLALGTVAAIEFLPVIGIAALGTRTRRNLAALVLATCGVYLVTGIVVEGEPIGVALAFANAALFAMYITLSHRLAERGATAGIDALASAMLVAAVAVCPVGLVPALPALVDPFLAVAGVGVGLCSSVIPYVTDQLAMARIKRSTYAVLVSLLPATATIVGLVLLGQIPRPIEIGGVGLVIAAVALHRDRDAQ